MKKKKSWDLSIAIIVVLTAALIVALTFLNPEENRDGKLTLLAVSETKDGFVGSTADLNLALKPGTGKIFIETFPLTKVDTQISTRLAKEIACSTLEHDCDNLDFIYQIRSESAIIGGPSAGASITALTMALLENKEVNRSVSITGTINSGGLIGTVGGIKEKIEAAKEQGLTKVLVPKGEEIKLDDPENESKKIFISPTEYGEQINITVQEVFTIEEVYEAVTGTRIVYEEKNIEANPAYASVMEELANNLCEKTRDLERRLERNNATPAQLAQIIVTKQKSSNLTQKAQKEYDKGNFYSAASYCFGVNVQYQEHLLRVTLDNNTLLREIDETAFEIEAFQIRVNNRSFTTISELQTAMIVSERLREADIQINHSATYYLANNTEKAIEELAIARERLYSAHSWSSFFDLEGKEVNLEPSALKESCVTKLAEAEERYQYINIYAPGTLRQVRRAIIDADADLNNERYAQCFFKASKAKANADTVLSVIGVDLNSTEERIDKKIEIVERTIADQVEKDLFPIMGYSYYEYGKSLRENDPYSSLLYLEYAAELSAVDIYFKEKELQIQFREDLLQAYILGLLSGMISTLIIVTLLRKK